MRTKKIKKKYKWEIDHENNENAKFAQRYHELLSDVITNVGHANMMWDGGWFDYKKYNRQYIKNQKTIRYAAKLLSHLIAEMPGEMYTNQHLHRLQEILVTQKHKRSFSTTREAKRILKLYNSGEPIIVKK